MAATLWIDDHVMHAAGAATRVALWLAVIVIAARHVRWGSRAGGAWTLRPATVLLLSALATTAHADVMGYSSALLRDLAQRWGHGAPVRVLHWQTHVALPSPGGELQSLAAVNAYWNRVRYADDPAHWQRPDYWATPVEMLASDGGDCEDYVFGKYFSLRQLGVAVEKLRMIYVMAAGVPDGHMVLAYYPSPDADPLILDNRTDEIVRASERTDLHPIYSFNDDDLWTAHANDRAGSSSQVRAWSELREKMTQEWRR